MNKIKNIDGKIEESRTIDNIIISVLIFLIVILIGLIAYRYSFITVEVSGSSMEKTIHNGENFVVNRFGVPKRGDIVVVNISSNKYWIIKRVIAVSGDSIKIDGEKVYLKTPEDEDYKLLDEEYAYYDENREEKNVNIEITIGEDEYFFLGDNRRNSNDSRYYGKRKYYDLVGVVTDWSIKKEGFWYKFDKIANAPSRLFYSLTKPIGE